MRVFLLLGLAVPASESVHVEINRFYHENFGIPEVQRIKDFEDKIAAFQNVEEDQRIVGGAIAPTNAHPYLIGVSSFVAGNGCQLGFPSAFARVTSFYNFIVHNM